MATHFSPDIIRDYNGNSLSLFVFVIANLILRFTACLMLPFEQS